MKRKELVTFSILGGIVLVGSIVAAGVVLRPKAIRYPQIQAQARHVEESVHASGIIHPAQNINLSFEVGGKITKVDAHVGDTVKAGQMIAELDNGTQAAQVAQAQAMLNQKIAGASQAELDIYRATLESAKADLEKAKTDTSASVRVAQEALDAAENNLHLTEGGDDSQIVNQAYDNAVATLNGVLPKLDDAMTQSDAILGVDNSAANLTFKDALSVLDSSKMTQAQSAYSSAKEANAQARALTTKLTETSSHTDVDAAITAMQTALAKTDDLLRSVSDVLIATIPNKTLSQVTPSGTTVINAMKSGIQGQRGVIAGQITAVVNAAHGIDNAKNGLNGVSIAYDKAKQDLETSKASANSILKLKQAAVDQAQANLDNRAQPARETDLAPLRASVAAASSVYEKTILRSPIDGVISKQDAKVGAIVAGGTPLASVFNEGGYQLELILSETDVAKVKVGDVASVTLDAYGSDTKFDATIVTINSTTVTENGKTGYKVTLQFAKADDRIKDGMTGNATVMVKQADAAIALPDSVLLQRSGKTVVLIQDGKGVLNEQEVQTGVRGSDGWTEILSGIQSGTSVADISQQPSNK